MQTSIDNPLETHGVNIDGTLHTLIASSENGVKRFVYSASSAAYGDHDELPHHEGMRTKPQHPYGLQKHTSEEYTRLAATLMPLETVSLRYFNVFGPRMSLKGAYSSVLSIFLQQRQKQQPLTITGDGLQTRDFIYVDDVVRANLLAMAADKVGKGEAINIGSGQSKTVNEIADLIGGPRQYLPPRVEIRHSQAHIQLAKELLGWEPQVPFTQGLKQTIDWFQNSFKDESSYLN